MVQINIAIFTVPLHNNHELKSKHTTYFTSYFPSSYVKWLEQSGAKVVPIKYNLPFHKIKTILKQVNGILFPGGAIDREHHNYLDLYIKNFKLIYDYCVEENNNGNYYPIWGTCLGFEFLCVMPLNNKLIEYNNLLLLSKFDSKHELVKFKLYKHAAIPIKSSSCNDTVIKNANIYMNHISGYKTDKETMNLFNKYLTVISSNKDRQGKEYISTIKYKYYPFYGTQWHPEKIAFEFNFPRIEHRQNDIAFSKLWSQFFIEECMKNSNQLNNDELLIYNYTLLSENAINKYRNNYFVGKHDSIFMQNYYFI